MWQTYYQPATLAEALALLAQHSSQSRLVAGGTDLLVELQRGFRPTATLIDISSVDELRYLRRDGDTVRLGALATHNDVLAWPDAVDAALPLAQACWEVGAPQIRARGTVAGNLVTASPANDTITPLVALDATLLLRSAAGERMVPLGEFYLGVRRTALQSGELLAEISFPALSPSRRGIFLKLGLRRAQAISVINVAIVLTLLEGRASNARIALGSLAPTIVRAAEAEAFLEGRQLDAATCAEAARLACTTVAPIDDLRGSAAYRLATLEALVADGLARLATGTEAQEFPTNPVLLETAGTPSDALAARASSEPLAAISTTINGKQRGFAPTRGKTLLDMLRDDAGLTGTKEGCAEGECGACTVWLDGQAVMACLVPAPQAHGARITTIEGLATGGELHPLQEAFIAHGAVQCGYCIPGMLMAGAKLLHEQPQPSLAAAQAAISGNICRCTGYRKILDAMLAAGTAQAPADG